MLGGGWVKVKGKRGRDKKHESLSPFTFKELSCLGVLLVPLTNSPDIEQLTYPSI
jgi:hypothetical protein